MRRWHQTHWWDGKGILWKVLVPMVTSPVVGLVGGFSLMGLLYFLLPYWRHATVNRAFGKLQLFSAACMGFSHGTNDAQKNMGIIALALKLNVVERILWAWVLTIPLAGLVAYGLVRLARFAGWLG